MEDRFKFRVWEKDDNLMSGVDLINFDKKCVAIFDSTDYEFLDLNNPNNILMQSSGIKDKNGKLIFEGDIVRVFGTEELGITEIDIKENCIIKWNEKSALYFCDVINKRGIKLTEHGYYDFDYLPLFQNESDEEMFDFEIIGNIYANQELLNGF